MSDTPIFDELCADMDAEMEAVGNPPAPPTRWDRFAAAISGVSPQEYAAWRRADRIENR